MLDRLTVCPAGVEKLRSCCDLAVAAMHVTIATAAIIVRDL
jgi:hypothetical protein